MSRTDYDVVVAGAGPAGSTTAHALALAGVRVAIVDRATFPRDKTCGGGVQAKALPYLLADIRPVTRSTLCRAGFTHRLGDYFERTHDAPLVYGVVRREFDHHLFRSAVEAGVTPYEGVAVRGFDQSVDSVQVRTATGSLSCRVLVGADGANGTVRRAVNPEGSFFQQAGLSVEIPREQLVRRRYDERTMRVDWGTLPSGYAWLFPKSETVNVGVGGPVAVARGLRRYLFEFLTRQGLLEGANPADLPVRGHKLPSFTQQTRLRDRNVLLVGDAAGFIDPCSGDGISFGVHGARLAAEAIRLQLGGEREALAGYERAVRRELVPELLHSRRLMSFLHTFTRSVHRRFKHDDRLWADFRGVLNGESSFVTFHRNRLGPLRLFKPLIDRVAAACESLRLRDAARLNAAVLRLDPSLEA